MRDKTYLVQVSFSESFWAQIRRSRTNVGPRIQDPEENESADSKTNSFYFILIWSCQVQGVVQSILYDYGAQTKFEHQCDVITFLPYAWGLTVSIRKTKAMTIISPNPPGCLSLFPNVSAEVVNEFPYLGCVISDSGNLDKEVSSRLSKASRAFGSLLNPIFLCLNLALNHLQTNSIRDRGPLFFVVWL